MVVSTKRAEVVAGDGEIAGRFRDYLEDLHYSVEVTDQIDAATDLDVDLVLYHVAEDAVTAERRKKVRSRNTSDASLRFWLDVVQHIAARAPAAQLVVALPPGNSAADIALESGATDVIEESCTPRLFRHRMEMLEAVRDVLNEAGASKASSADFGVGHGLGDEGKTRLEQRSYPGLELPLPELRNAQSGRIDAREVAVYMGISLKQLAASLATGYPGLHKTPDSSRIQGKLRPIVRVLELANRAFGNREQTRKWLNRPLLELDDESPLAVILSGEADAVETLLNNALTGIPV